MVITRGENGELGGGVVNEPSLRPGRLGRGASPPECQEQPDAFGRSPKS